MRSPIAAGALATVLAATLAAGGPQVPDQATSFPTAVEEVLVDVVVADHDGNPIDPFERSNLWLLYSALSQGLDRVRFICLWNGGGGDGAGGTAHMVKEVTRRTGQVTWLDTRELW